MSHGPAVGRVLAALDARGYEPKPSGEGYVARCPAHEDRVPSLSLTAGADGRALVKCHAGCEFGAIVAGLGLAARDLFARAAADVDGLADRVATNPSAPFGGSRQRRSEFEIRDRAGNLIAVHIRLDGAEGKKFFWRRPDGRRGLGGLKTADLPLFGAEELPGGGTVAVVEGETARLSLREHGIPSVATVTGAASTPSAAVLRDLAAFDVVLWADHDDAGRAHMERIAKRLLGIGVKARVVHWTGASEPGDDAADFFRRGGTTAGALELIASAKAPEEAPKNAGDEAPHRASDKDERPVVRLVPGGMPDVVRDALHALAHDARAPRVFERNGLVVRVVRDAAPPSSAWLVRPSNAPVVAPVDAPWLAMRLQGSARFMRYDERVQGWVERDCPDAVAAKALAQRGEWKLPVLAAVVEFPPIRADGSVCTDTGYDPSTGLLFDAESATAVCVPSKPTATDARAAFARLRALMSDFPFMEEADFSAWLAFVLSLLCRHLFMLCPAFAFDAPVRASGKTLAADVACHIALGRLAAKLTPSADDGENRKRLFSLALEGVPVALIDNVARRFGGEAFDAVVTAGTVMDRLLGKNEMRSVEFRTVLALTGNNLAFDGDFVRRVVPCRLVPACENPELRGEFKIKDLREHVAAARGELLGAALTVVAAYLRAGRPEQPVRACGGFDAWRRVVPSAIVFAGGADPLQAQGRLAADVDADPDVQLARRLLGAVYSQFGIAPFAVAELAGRVELGPILCEVAPAEGGGLNTQKLGLRLRRWRDAARGGLVLRPVEPDRARGVARWRIEVLAGVDGPGERRDCRDSRDSFPSSKGTLGETVREFRSVAAGTPGSPGSPGQGTAEGEVGGFATDRRVDQPGRFEHLEDES